MNLRARAAWLLVPLVLLAAACAPSKDIESPADPPGIEKEDQKNQSGDGAEVSASAEAESDEESDSGE